MVVDSNPLTLSTSLAGSWGDEIRKKLLVSAKDPTTEQRFQTVTRSSFSIDPFIRAKTSDPSKYNKFQNLQQNGAIIVNKSAYEREQKESTDSGFLDSFNFATAGSSFSPSRYSLSRQGSRVTTAATSRGETVSASTGLGCDERLSTISRSSYRPPSKPNPFDFESSVDLKTTSYRMLRSNDAPIAVGRSGRRVERGVSTSGLLGERLSLSQEPQWNTLAQKAWLYCDDPAVHYKINGVPKATPVTDRSLMLPCEVAGDRGQTTWKNHRKAILTGDLSTSTGRARAGVFLDEFDVTDPSTFHPRK